MAVAKLLALHHQLFSKDKQVAIRKAEADCPSWVRTQRLGHQSEKMRRGAVATGFYPNVSVNLVPHIINDVKIRVGIPNRAFYYFLYPVFNGRRLELADWTHGAKLTTDMEDSITHPMKLLD